MIKTIILDDQEKDILHLREMIINLSSNFEITVFKDISSCFNYIKNHEIDVAFLDIELDDEKSFMLVDELRRDSIVIFVTDYPQYSIDSHGYRTLAFIEKSKLETRLCSVIREVEMIFLERTKTIQVSGKKDIFLNHIIYFKKRLNYFDIKYVTASEKILDYSVRKTIDELKEELDDTFIQIALGVFVNFEYIKEFSYDQVVMYNQERIFIGEKYRKEAQSHYHRLQITRIIEKKH